MAIKRATIEKLANLTAGAIIDELERAKKEERAPHHAALAGALKLLAGVEVARGEEPIVEKPSRSEPAAPRPLDARKMRLILPYLTDEEKAALDQPLPAVDDDF
jgi:hypothetical protein